MQFDEVRQHDVAHGEHISSLLDQLARLSTGALGRATSATRSPAASPSSPSRSTSTACRWRSPSTRSPSRPSCRASRSTASPGTSAARPTPCSTRRWTRHVLDGADGWDKWDGGVWFHKLFYEDLPPDSEQSSVLATEMWTPGASHGGAADRLHRRACDPPALHGQHELEPGQRRVRTRARPRRGDDRCRRHQQQPRLLLGRRQGRMQAQPRGGARARATTSSATTTTRSSSRSSSGSTRGTADGGRR